MADLDTPVETVLISAVETEKLVSESLDLLSDDEPEKIATGIAEIQATRSRLADVLDRAERRLMGLIPKGETFVVTGVGAWERSGSSKRRWNHDEIWKLVLARGRDEQRVDMETGEVLVTEGEAVASAIRRCAGIGYWKVGELTQLLGIEKADLDDEGLCSTEWKPKLKRVD